MSYYFYDLVATDKFFIVKASIFKFKITKNQENYLHMFCSFFNYKFLNFEKPESQNKIQ